MISSYDVMKYYDSLFDALKYVALGLVMNESDMTYYICYALSRVTS